MPEFPSFVGPAYRLDTPNAAGDRAVNLFLEQVEQGPRQGKLRQRKTPGLKFFHQIGTGPIRALWSNATDLFCVSGGELWQVNNPSQAHTHATLIGPVANGTNPATIVTNGFQLLIASAGQLYFDAGDGTGVRPVVDIFGTPVAAATATFLDNYIIVNIPNTKQIQISALAPNGATWDPADVAEKEGQPDNILRVYADNEQLFLFGNDTLEVWINTGGLFPFSRIQGAVFPIGCDSAWSVAGAAGIRMWLWKGVVWAASGLQPTRVSDFGVEQAIKGYTLEDQQNSEAFAWVDAGHLFYALSFPFSGATWVFDYSNKTWHERLYYSNGQYGRFRGRVYARAFGLDLVGDYASNAIYSMDPTWGYDAPPITNPAGTPVPLRWRRVCPYITDNLKNTRYNRLTLDMDTGVGLQVPVGQVAQDPHVMMRYSRNRGKTWSNERQASLGAVGEYDKRVFFNQLGSSYVGLACDVYGTDPVLTSINAAYIDLDGSTAPRP